MCHSEFLVSIYISSLITPHQYLTLLSYCSTILTIGGVGTGKKEEKKGSSSTSQIHSAPEKEQQQQEIDAMDDDVVGTSKDGSKKGQGSGQQGLGQGGVGFGQGKAKSHRQGVRSLEDFVSLPSDPMMTEEADDEEGEGEGDDEDNAVSGPTGASTKAARTEPAGVKGGIGASRNTHKKRRTEEEKEATLMVGGADEDEVEGKGSGKAKATKAKAAATTSATSTSITKGNQKKGGKK